MEPLWWRLAWFLLAAITISYVIFLVFVLFRWVI